MKKISAVTIAIVISFSALAQENINWLSIDKFEKAVNKKNKKSFILIDEVRAPNAPKKDALKKRTKRAFSFLEDKDLVDYINKNFICFRYSPSKEPIIFNGKKYGIVEPGKIQSHDFVSFLSSTNDNRAPMIIIKDEKFELYTFKRAVPDIEKLEIFLEAERRKTDYILQKVEKESAYATRAINSVENFQKQLDKAKSNPSDISIFQSRQEASRILSILKYFISGEYKKVDLRKYMEKNK